MNDYLLIDIKNLLANLRFNYRLYNLHWEAIDDYYYHVDSNGDSFYKWINANTFAHYDESTSYDFEVYSLIDMIICARIL